MKLRDVMTPEFELLHSRHPHLSQKIMVLWGQPECITFINQLMQDTRDGQRSGFSHEIAHALFALLNLHDKLFPRPKTSDPWDHWRTD